MSLGFLNAAMLFGLAGLAIPIIIHLWNRRRHDVVDWGAMQFLLVSSTKRRRFVIEELLLLLLRMGLIALLVLGLAKPQATGDLAEKWTRARRDVVFVLDASASMEAGRGTSPWVNAREKIRGEMQQMGDGDRVAVILATVPVQRSLGELTDDLREAERVLDDLPEPSGPADGPAAFAEAWRMLREHGQAPRREIVVLTEGQPLGWTDDHALFRWQQLGQRYGIENDPAHWRFVSVRPSWADDADLANVGLSPLKPSRSIVGVGQKVTFTSTLTLTGPKLVPPRRLYVERDGKWLMDLPALTVVQEKNPLRFEVRFPEAGPHRVSLVVETDPAHDLLPGDNRQDRVVEVLQGLPILLVSSDIPMSAESTTYFLERAFARPADPFKVSVVVPRVTSAKNLSAESLQPVDDELRPRVVVLADVPRLSNEQAVLLEKYLADGGSVFMTLGPNTQADFWNDTAYRDGKGWLPARLDKIVNVAEGKEGARLDVPRFSHSALEIFKEESNCSLGQAAHRYWWKVTPAEGATVATFTNGSPWLVEKHVGKGRVLLSTLPFDKSWDGHLTKAWEFPVLVHELMYALGDVRARDFNLLPGQPLTIARNVPLPTTARIQGRDGKTRAFPIQTWPATIEAFGPSGVYHLQVGGETKVPIVVQSEPREFDLRYGADAEMARVAAALPIVWENDGPEKRTTASGKADIWWLFFLGVIGFLCVEVALTRRMVRGRVVS